MPRSATTTCATATASTAALARRPAGHRHPPGRRGRRHRREPREPRPVLLRERDHGHPADGASPPGRRGQVRHDRHRLLLPQVHARPVPRGRLWDGYPEETNAPYGIAKKMLLVQGQAYREQYGFDVDPPDPGQPLRARRQLRPGQLARHPGADQEVRRRARARRGLASRSGAPAAPRASSCTSTTRREGIVLAAERYDGAEPVNLGVGARDHDPRAGRADRGARPASRARSAGTRSKPDGQPRRALDTSRARDGSGSWRRRRSRRGCGGRSSGISHRGPRPAPRRKAIGLLAPSRPGSRPKVTARALRVGQRVGATGSPDGVPTRS